MAFELPTKPRAHGHKWYECPGNHAYANSCQFCDGGLGWCIRCDCFEGELTYTCPGRKMTREEKALSYAGWLNFVNGRWIKKRPALIVEKYLHPGARGEKANAAVSKTVGATLGGSTPPAPTIHRCHWPNCIHEVPPRLWGCRFHWFKLPKELRDAIWRTYVPGQEVTKTPSPAYIKAAQAVQEWIKGNRE